MLHDIFYLVSRNIHSVDVNSLLPMPVLIRKYNIPNSYEKRELFEVIYSFQIDY